MGQVGEQDIPCLASKTAFPARFHAQSRFIVAKLLDFGPTTVVIVATFFIMIYLFVVDRALSLALGLFM